jgi:hypothetical protein
VHILQRTITMRPGEVQRWRILHAGWQDDIFMELDPATNTAGGQPGQAGTASTAVKSTEGERGPV